MMAEEQNNQEAENKQNLNQDEQVLKPAEHAAEHATENSAPADRDSAVPGASENETAPAESAQENATQENAAQENAELSELDQALLENAQLKEQLARRNADMYNLQQEYANYVKRTKFDAQTHKEAGVRKVLEVLLNVLDNAALAREHGELTGPAGKVVEELENTLATNFQLSRFGAVGEEFDPLVHEALMHQTSAEAEKEEISVLIQAGYKQGEKVLRPARVGVLSPE